MRASRDWCCILRIKNTVGKRKSSEPADFTLLFVVRGVRVLCHKERVSDKGGGDGRAGSSCLVCFRWLEVFFPNLYVVHHLIGIHVLICLGLVMPRGK